MSRIACGVRHHFPYFGRNKPSLATPTTNLRVDWLLLLLNLCNNASEDLPRLQGLHITWPKPIYLVSYFLLSKNTDSFVLSYRKWWLGLSRYPLQFLLHGVPLSNLIAIFLTADNYLIVINTMQPTGMGIIVISVTIVQSLVALLFICLRGWVRVRLINGFQYDDYLLWAAMVCMPGP